MQSLIPGSGSAPSGSRPDPAPSRWAYRLHRLMLTPLFRLSLRVGLPFAVALGGATIYLSDELRRDAVLGALRDMRAAIESRPEFAVNLMAIDGASPGVAEDIREVLSIDFPTSSFDLDLDHIREVIIGLDPVKSASARIRQGGVLQIDVTERQPVALWRAGTGLELLDATGAYVGPAGNRVDHPELPLIAGRGADRHVGEALRLIAAAGPLEGRLRGLVRQGERRWDLVLDRGQRIQLPPEGAVRALERVIAMDQVQDVLARDLALVDMRLPQRPTLRLNEEAMQQMWRIRQAEWGGMGR